MSSLSINNLQKSFKSNWTFRSKQALTDITFTVDKGDLFGLLGHNGAGKTTTIKIILDLIRADSGTIYLDEIPLTHVSQRRGFGYLPELPYFYDHLTVKETLEYLGALALRGHRYLEIKNRVAEVLDTVGLKARRDHKVRSLSKGLQQRLGLAQAIINRPTLLLLDEPFSGLDPLGRAEFRTVIQELNSSGTTVVISSHILSDVQQLSNRVAIIANGEVRTAFSLTDRAQLFGEKKLVRFQTSAPVDSSLVAQASDVTLTESHGAKEYSLIFEDQYSASEALEAIIHGQTEGDCHLLEYRSEPKSLEEIFLEVTKTQ